MLNADDWLISDGIRKLNEKILEDNAHFAIGNANFVDEDGHHFYTARTNSFDDRILVSGMSFCHQAVLASKLCFDEVGFFDESLQLSGDYKWIRQLFWAGKTATLVDQPVVNFSYTGLTKTHRPIMKREAQILFLEDFSFISPQQAKQFFEFVYRDAPLNTEFYETLRLGRESNQFLLSMSMYLVQRLIECEETRTKQRVLDLQPTRTLAIELFRRITRKVLRKSPR
jgi:hypothetical protein